MTARLAAGAVLVAVAGGVAAFLLTGDGSRPALQPWATAGTIGPEGQELLALLERGRRQTFHATYHSVGARAQGRMTVEIWREPPLEREDTILEAAGGVTHLSAFLLADGVIACTRSGLGAWACRRAGASAAPSAFAVLEAMHAQLAGKKVAVRDVPIDGRATRCFVLALDAGDAELCLDPEGIPVRLVAGDAGLALAALSRKVPDGVFRPPAEAA